MISKLNPWFALIFSVVSVCQALSGDCADNLVMTAPGGWLELEEPPLFTKDGRRFTMALSANGYKQVNVINRDTNQSCLLYTSPSPRDATLSRMPSSA